MRKINLEFLEMYRKKDLKEYSKILNRFLKEKWSYFFIVLLTSCSVQNEINKDDFNTIPKHFSASFYDKLDTINNQYDNQIFTRSLMKDFTNVTTIDYSKPIQLEIRNKELFLKFNDIYKKQIVLKFYGKNKRKKFVFYTNYETVSFPVLFMRKQMTEYSIYSTNNNELIFAKYNVSEGMFLMFGAGTSSKSDYKFKIIKNE
jgi:hypothetical protein